MLTTDLLDTWIQPFIPIEMRRKAQNIVDNKVMLPAIIKASMYQVQKHHAMETKSAQLRNCIKEATKELSR